ncbi:MAG: NAD(P)-binding domain-containing protein, partial [Candidatus Binataceae bacterium]
MSRTLSIVGAGRVGCALGKRLGALGWRVGAVVTRSMRTARAAVRVMDEGEPWGKLTNHVFKADVILLAVPDDRLASVARELAKIGGPDCRGKIVLHTSGSLGREVLASFARRGASTGSLHPMQTFSGRGIPRLKGVIFAIEGDPGAQIVARKIARAL